MAVINCNITKIVHALVVAKKYGIQCNELQLKSDFVKAYIQELGCIDLSNCVTVIAPCNSVTDSNCNGFVSPGFGFQHQSFGTNIDFIVNESALNGAAPYSYVWEFDATRYAVRNSASTSQSTIQLLKINEQATMNYITNITVTVTDANGCTVTKTCQFTYIKVNGQSQGAMQCNEDSFQECTEANMSISVNNTNLTVTWNDVGLQYSVSVISDEETTLFTDEYVTSPLLITGITPGTSFTVYLKTYCPDGTVEQEDEDGETTDIPMATLTCSGIFIHKEDIYVGTSYTGVLTVPYTLGNGLSYSAQSFTSNGLSYSLPSGVLSVGAGNLQYSVSGIPTADINVPINLFGNSCTFTHEVDTCVAPLEIEAEIGDYNTETGLYPVTLTWTAVEGATQYNLTIDGEVSIVTGTSFTFAVPPQTEFSGSISTRCSPIVSSEQVPFEGETPEEPQNCTLTDFSYSTTDNSITITGTTPALLPGESITWSAVRTGGGYSPTGTTFSLPFVITNLTAGQFTLTVTKNCIGGGTAGPVIKILTVADI